MTEDTTSHWSDLERRVCAVFGLYSFDMVRELQRAGLVDLYGEYDRLRGAELIASLAIVDKAHGVKRSPRDRYRAQQRNGPGHIRGFQHGRR